MLYALTYTFCRKDSESLTGVLWCLVLGAQPLLTGVDGSAAQERDTWGR